MPASKAWAVYGTLELAKLVVGKVVDAVEVVEGDGGMGTIMIITLNPGMSLYYKMLDYSSCNKNM